LEPMPNFSVCYLFKDQTQLAVQKLTKFAERIQNTTNIWETLKKYYITNQFLELKDNRSLEALITEIFVDKTE